MITSFIVLQIVFDLWIFWKLFNQNRSLLLLLNAADDARTNIVKLVRSLNKEQLTTFTDQKCQHCGNVLPENTEKTHDGLRLCSSCKVKRAEAAKKVLDDAAKSVADVNG